MYAERRTVEAEQLQAQRWQEERTSDRGISRKKLVFRAAGGRVEPETPGDAGIQAQPWELRPLMLLAQGPVEE
jgi:hypothetical protein